MKKIATCPAKKVRPEARLVAVLGADQALEVVEAVVEAPTTADST